MKKRIVSFMIGTLIGMMVLSGCSKGGETITSDTTENVDATQSEENSEKSEVESESKTESESENEKSESDENDSSTEEAEDDSKIYKELEGQIFIFCSGVGAWETVIGINEDGSFTGHFMDANMGESSPKYENGTVYASSQVEGQFEDIKKIDDNTYSVKIGKLDYIEKTEEGYDSFVADKMLYILCSPRGLIEGDEMLIYTPGKAVSEIPQECIDWVGWAIGLTPSPEDDEDIDISDAKLDQYILYDKDEEIGFFATEYAELEFKLPDASERKEYTGLYYTKDELDEIDFTPKHPYESVTLKNLQGTWVNEYDENDGSHVVERLTVDGNHGYIEDYVNGVKSSAWNGDGEAIITDRSDENKCPKFVIVDHCAIYIRWVSEDEFYDGGFCNTWKKEK